MARWGLGAGVPPLAPWAASAARDSWYSRHLRSLFLSPADRFSFPGDALLLPCSLRSLPGSGKFFLITSHRETLIEAPEGYTLGSSSSSIPSGRRPSPGPVRPGPRPPAPLLVAVLVPLPPAASPPRPAGGRGRCPCGARSSWACRLRTGGCCGGSAWSETNPRSRRAAWGWGRGHVLPASCQFTMAAGALLVLKSLMCTRSTQRTGCGC